MGFRQHPFGADLGVCERKNPTLLLQFSCRLSSFCSQEPCGEMTRQVGTYSSFRSLGQSMIISLGQCLSCAEAIKKPGSDHSTACLSFAVLPVARFCIDAIFAPDGFSSILGNFV